MNTHKLNYTERRAIISLSSIMGLRMMGLFMALPVFSLYASQLPGATATLVGVALGVYGLTQALFQIPFGALSDRIGRKPVILIGLLIFAIGSLIAGLAHNMMLLIIGRALQGTGAVGGTILAMVADFTREEQRTKAMAIAGISIGFSFSLAMLLGPLLTPWIAVSGLFFLAMLLGLVAIVLLFTYVPTPVIAHWHGDTEPERHSLLKLLRLPELAKLNSGIFLLHCVFTATFVVLPISLQNFTGLEAKQQWLIYLPSLLLALMITLAGIHFAERRQQIKAYFLASIAAIIFAEIIIWQAQASIGLMALGICLFFAGFSLLEGFLPSLVSRTAPAAQKGSALGIFSCSQFLGIFAGGVLGGWLFGKHSFSGVYLFCIVVALFWFALAVFMRAPVSKAKNDINPS